MERPHVNILVHERVGKLVSVRDVIGVLEFYKENLQYDENLQDNRLAVGGAVYAVEALLGEVGRWLEPPEMIGS